MIYNKTDLEGAYTIDPEPFEDARGFFTRFYCHDEFKANGLVTDFVQGNHSGTTRKGSIRGMHMQLAPRGETKLVKCIKGRIYDVIIDVRRSSPDYLKWFGAELSEGNKRMMYVPKGFAHGFQTLEENSEIMYLVSQFYSKEHELSLRFDDPAIGIKWPLPLTAISDKDAGALLIQDDFKGYTE